MTKRSFNLRNVITVVICLLSIGIMFWACDDPKEELEITVKGKVTDCNNNPVKYVRLHIGSTTTSTDENGEYTASIPAGSPAYVTVKSNDYHNYLPEVSYEIPELSEGGLFVQDIELPCPPEKEFKLFGIEAAVVTYQRRIYGETILTFDNFGKRLRVEYNYGKPNHTIEIFDGIAEVEYYYRDGEWSEYKPENGYESVAVMVARAKAIADEYYFNKEFYATKPDYTEQPLETIYDFLLPLPESSLFEVKPSMDIQMQECEVITYNTYMGELPNKIRVAGWMGLVWAEYSYYAGGGLVIILATDINRTPPSDAFTKTLTPSWIF